MTNTCRYDMLNTRLDIIQVDDNMAINSLYEIS